MIQTENGKHRLQRDLRALERWCGANWPEVGSKLRFFDNVDSYLSLADPRNVAKIRQAIECYQPDFIILDPLRDFAAGDLNSDADMAATIEAIRLVANSGGIRRTVIVLHHSLTGRAGAIKATGIERGSYARNSKVLNGWTRAQINVVPANENGNQALLISCGKNSNGREFEPIECRLNPETMIYEVAHDVTPATLAAAIAEKAGSGAKCTIETAFELLSKSGSQQSKASLVRLLQTETGIGKSRAYNIAEQLEKHPRVKFNSKKGTYAVLAS
jgi:hypothetical protein